MFDALVLSVASWIKSAPRLATIAALKRLAARLLYGVLLVQQLLLGTPARAAINVQGGKPVDTGALRDSSATSRPGGIEPSLFTGES